MLILSACQSETNLDEHSAEEAPGQTLEHYISKTSVFGHWIGNPTQTKGWQELAPSQLHWTACDLDYRLRRRSTDQLVDWIEVALNTANCKQEDALFAALVEHMDQLYQESLGNPQYVTWKTSGPQGALVEVALTDHRQTFGNQQFVLSWKVRKGIKYED